ncbi:MAG: NAD(+) diphosphatase [Anaerolineaceae bacterium]|nr:NAD(+) diphosphatase [Anaerolineaceae bacterium]
MIQDIYPDIFINHFEHFSPDPKDSVIYFQDGGLLVHYNTGTADFEFPNWAAFTSTGKNIYLFTVGEERFFLLMEAADIPAGFKPYSLRELRALQHRSNKDMFIFYTAWHLWQWYRTNRFCGCCGAETEFDTLERALICPKCGNKIYPRINPAVIVGVTNGDSIVLTRYKGNHNYNALVAGFTEIGETVEETVRREVMEEVGLKVKNIRYYKSQPWGIASDILMGFYCDVDGDDTIHRDDSELKYAEWVKREDIELQPDALSLTNEMMMMFKENKDRPSGRQDL